MNVEIVVILNRPKNAGNIGAIARVMKNFDLNYLVLINPDVNHLCSESRARAKHAVDVLENALVQEELKDIRDVDFLIGTSARVGGDYNTPRIAVPVNEIGSRLKDFKGRVGILFGREDSGLSNEDLEACDFLVTIPVSSEYRSLNLSHAACIVFYELFKMRSESERDLISCREASRKELDHLMEKYDEILNFLGKTMKKFTERRMSDARRVFRNVVSRAFISGREAHTLMGVFRHVLEQMQGVWRNRK
ncbi:MAG: RNA methyltransferase [Candidatus Helarchaeales archaeon]